MAKRKRIARTPKKVPGPKRTKTGTVSQPDTSEEMGATATVEEKEEVPQESPALDQPEVSLTEPAGEDNTAAAEPTSEGTDVSTNVSSDVLDVTDTSCAESCSVLQDLLSNTLGREDELDPDNPPEEFVFAPIVDELDVDVTTVDLITPSNSRHASGNAEDKGEVPTTRKTATAKDESSTDGGECSRTAPVEIEVIDLDDLPDTPTPTSSYGDDIIEITTPDRSERGESPEVILDRQVVDLTGTCDCDSASHTDIDSDLDDISDATMLSLWSRMSKKKKKSHKKSSSLNKDDSTTEKSPPDKPEEKPAESGSSRTLSCPVCMDDFSLIVKDGRQLMSTSCGHVFCSVCIKAAMETQKRCPTCRKKQTQKNLHPIFL